MTGWIKGAGVLAGAPFGRYGVIAITSPVPGMMLMFET